MEDILQDLNEEQKQAVTATEGFIRVIAGAGSGKTRALAHRFAYLVCEAGIMPGNILCVTFTNKSANEMRQRIHRLTGDNDTGYICTFHSFCVSVLQEDSHAVNYPKNFLVLDNSDIDAMLALIYEERGLTMRDMTFGNARDMIEIRKIFKEPQYYEDMIRMDIDKLHEKYMNAVKPADIIFYGYLYQEKKCFGLDYNDLIKFTLYIFQINEEIRLKWQQRLEYIMIDEFQDIDQLQYELMCVLCAHHKNLFIVGDPDQTIYTWRGANVRYLLDFDKNFPETRTIMMMQNYRSTPEILNVANSLIDKNKSRIKKDLQPVLPSGIKTQYLHADSSEDEANWIAKQIAGMRQDGIPYRNMAILYRAHYITRSLEDALIREQIPYVIYSGAQFFDRMEIKDALCYLRLVAYRDDLSFRRIVNKPKRNIGQRRMKFLEDYAEANGCLLYQALTDNIDDPIFKGTQAAQFISLIETYALNYRGRNVSEILSAILSDSGYEEMMRTEGSQERLDNLAELKQSIYEYETTCGEEITLESYLSHIALFSNADAIEAHDKVKLMTIHTAKGLEFPHVFLCALNEGIIPSKKTRTIEAMEEERRLAFVAITRAERSLYLTEANGWQHDGSPRYPSRFILDIDDNLLEPVRPIDRSIFNEARQYVQSASKYLTSGSKKQGLPAGTRIRHSIFGEGTVLELIDANETHVIQFDGMSTPRIISFKAKLEVIE